jgi:hypothetical protein
MKSETRSANASTRENKPDNMTEKKSEKATPKPKSSKSESTNSLKGFFKKG